MDTKEDEGTSQGPIASPAPTARGKQRAAPDSEATSSAPPQSQVSKRRRGIGVVTPNACNECRKKRVKVSPPFPDTQYL